MNNNNLWTIKMLRCNCFNNICNKDISKEIQFVMNIKVYVFMKIMICTEIWQNWQYVMQLIKKLCNWHKQMIKKIDGSRKKVTVYFYRIPYLSKMKFKHCNYIHWSEQRLQSKKNFTLSKILGILHIYSDDKDELCFIPSALV